MGTGAWIALIFGFIFALLGVIFLVVALVGRKKAQTSKAWPTTQGTVVSAELHEHENYDAEDHHTTINYEPVVHYSYSVMGTPYNGSKIAFGANQFDRGTAQKKLAPYVAGSQVTVHYNPDKPAEAVLETEAAGSKVFLIIGIVFAVLGLMVCCIGVGIALMAK